MTGETHFLVNVLLHIHNEIFSVYGIQDCYSHFQKNEALAKCNRKIKSSACFLVSLGSWIQKQLSEALSNTKYLTYLFPQLR